VDFFAADRKFIAPYEEAVAEGIAKVKNLLGDDLPPGAIFICSTLAQRDSLYEPVAMRQGGYSWVLVSVTPEMEMEARLDSFRVQMGDNLPEEIRQRLSNATSNVVVNVDPQMVTTMVRNIAFAILQTKMNDENFQFRSSRVGDVGKSPLQDWIDVGIGAYVSGDRSAVRYLQENLDMAFPLEDVLFMSQPFLASSVTGGATTQQRGAGGMQGIIQMLGGNAQEIMQMMGGGQGGGGTAKVFTGGGAPKSKPEGGGQRTMSKDEQDRMLFDGQAISFFDYFLEKFGIEKMRELIGFASERNESWDYVVRPDILGRDFSKIESDVNEWLMKLPVPDPKPKFLMQQ
jgi:hypothetical protein